MTSTGYLAPDADPTISIVGDEVRIPPGRDVAKALEDMKPVLDMLGKEPTARREWWPADQRTTVYLREKEVVPL